MPFSNSLSFQYIHYENFLKTLVKELKSIQEIITKCCTIFKLCKELLDGLCLSSCLIQTMMECVIQASLEFHNVREILSGPQTGFLLTQYMK